MARRFTDTEKWRDDWWGSLPNDYRMIWLYLVDSCSIAGIWKKDFRGLNFNCNTSITEDEFLKVFGERVIDRGNFFFIPKFVRFQCPKGLKSNKPAVVSIVKELHSYSLLQTVSELFGNDYLIIKGKDKGKGTDKGEGNEEGKGIPKIDDIPKLPNKLEIFESMFNDRQWLEGVMMTHRGRDIQQAFEECWMHHSQTPNPPTEVWQWKQKLNTWLTIGKSNGNGTHKNGTAGLTAQGTLDRLNKYTND